MNTVCLIGRATKDADVRATQDGKKVARYTLAVERGKDKEPDYINCVAFDGRADFAERFIVKGIKIGVTGRLRSGSYTNKDGVKIYTTDVYVGQQFFCEPKKEQKVDADGFVPVFDDEELPF